MTVFYLCPGKPKDDKGEVHMEVDLVDDLRESAVSKESDKSLGTPRAKKRVAQPATKSVAEGIPAKKTPTSKSLKSASTKKTRTSTFGVSKREGHDATDFYSRFPELKQEQSGRPVRPEIVDKIFVGDSRDMNSVADNSVALVVTSPPYYAGKAYELERGAGGVPGDYVDYLRMLHDVFAECWRVLEPGGRIAINVANLGRRPFRSLSGDVIRILQDDIGFLLRGEIIWIKAEGASGSCAWGSFQSAANPVFRDLTERVVVASKLRLDRALTRKQRAAEGFPHVDTISKEAFMEGTLDTWRLRPESAKRVGHPAPFPVELPKRLIELFTYKDDLVLDPFMGAGTSAIAAIQTERHFIGYEMDSEYVELAERRIASEIS